MCNCDCDSPSIYQETQRLARKKHKCCKCGWMIQPHSKYIEIAGLWEGKWSNYKQCFNCNQIGDRFVQETNCCYPLGQLYSCLKDTEIIVYDKDSKSFVSSVEWLKIISHSPLKVLGLAKDEYWC